MSGDGTVEWGEDRPVRLLDRLFGDGGGGGTRLSAPALGAAIVATALFVVAELLPWMTIEMMTSSFNSPTSTTETREMSLDLVGSGIATAYYIGLLALLALAGLVQVSRPHTRRVLIAAGIGVAAGMLVLLVGSVRRAGDGGETTFYPLTSATTGPAPYVAIAAVLAAATALVLSGWHPSVPGRRRPVAGDQMPDDDDDEEPGPIDLTVTPA
jgi:hypothetical protein